AQQRRLEAGELGAEALRLDERRELHVGDQVLLTAIYRPPAPGAESWRWAARVENGTPGVVRAIDLERSEVELELEEAIQDDADGRRSPPRRLWVGAEVRVELGYARHVYKAQGVTVETADLAVSLRTHRN